MSGATSIIGLALSAVGVAASISQGNKAARQQKDAAKKAQANANQTAAAADQANNRANQKSPDSMAILDAASQAGKTGASGTMLTGPQGVDPNALSLGKNTLLGA